MIVKIKTTATSYRGRYNGMDCKIERGETKGSVGVRIIGVEPNSASGYGLYWFKEKEIEMIEIIS